MDTITSLQQSMLKLHPAPHAYFVGSYSAAQLAAINDVSDLTVFAPSESAETVKGLRYRSQMDTQDAAAARLLSFDLHINGEQVGYELRTLKNLTPIIRDKQPILFLRAEDPDQSTLNVIYLNEVLRYNSFYVGRFANVGDKEPSELWLVGIPKAVELTLGDRETAMSTGHPKSPLDVPFQLEVI